MATCNGNHSASCIKPNGKGYCRELEALIGNQPEPKRVPDASPVDPALLASLLPNHDEWADPTADAALA